MAREFGRSSRVASQMQKELAYILQREIADSRLGLITINEVEITKDLAYAKIYITILTTDESQKLDQIKLLNQLAPSIRSHLAKRMQLRHISELKFFYDHSFDKGMRIEQLLKEVPQSASSE
ncbi:MAG: hypothetical protein RL637_933 [Pseudomonadota bacterium]|jgi:ribosome-binding factor A